MALQANRGKRGGARKGAGRKPSVKPRGGYRVGSGRKKGPASAGFQSIKIENPNADSLTIMREHMRFCRKLANYWSNQKGDNTAKIMRFMREAADVASKIAPFEHSKLATTVLKGGNAEEPVHHKITVEYV